MNKNRSEWEQILKQSPELLWDRVNKPDDLANDEQLLANGYVLEYDHEVLGKMNVVGSPVHFHRTPADVKGIAPELGEHTEEVLIDICGVEWDDIASLRDEGII